MCPANIGQAIGIIGGLILGQAAVAANLVSSVVLIVVALTGLGNFCIPDYSTQLAAAFFRLTLTIAAWIGGLLGVICLMTVFLAWMASLKSYGVPFLAPFSPKAHSQKPMILRGAPYDASAGGGHYEHTGGNAMSFVREGSESRRGEPDWNRSGVKRAFRFGYCGGISIRKRDLCFFPGGNFPCSCAVPAPCGRNACLRAERPACTDGFCFRKICGEHTFSAHLRAFVRKCHTFSFHGLQQWCMLWFL